MDVQIDDRWRGFVHKAVDDGRYSSTSELIEEALRLVQEREDAFHALKEAIKEGLDESGDCTFDDVRADLDEIDELMRQKAG